MTRNRWTTGMAAAAALALAAPAARAVPIAPGYTVSEIALPDFAAGDVVVVGDALFVGAGPGFVGGAQSIVRIDAGGTTVVAQGFQGLGGIAYDAANDRLLVTDNALEAPPLTKYAFSISILISKICKSSEISSYSCKIFLSSIPTNPNLLIGKVEWRFIRLEIIG